MKRTIGLFLLMALSVNLTFGQKTISNITFKKDLFEQSLTNAVAPNVMGYQFFLIRNGQIVSEKADGKAQSSKDGNLDMTVNTPTDIGSLAKFLSGTAMLNLMEHPSNTTADAGKSMSQRLDRKFITLLPLVWSQNVKSGVENISLRQILQHRTGFDTDKSGNRTVMGYLKDANGFLPEQFDQTEYANINFVLNGFLLPLYEKPTRVNLFNSLLQQGQSSSLVDKTTRANLGSDMHQLMKQRIWDKMTPKILPNCDGKNTIADKAAYGYASKNDANKGSILSILEKEGQCGGHGGYYISGRDFANYVAHFSATELIVSKETRDLMFKEGMNAKDRLVWSLNFSNSWLTNNFGMAESVWSNGVTGNGFRSILVRLPQNYYLMIFTNSPDLDVFQLRNAGINAFRAGMEHNF